jgi:urea carboxylase-associated protein 2
MDPPRPSDPLATATLEAARDHARGQAGTGATTTATIPVTDAVDLPPGVDPACLRWDETLDAGGYAARRLPRGTILRVTDLDGDACVNLQLANARDPGERLNPPDTVKVQWQAYLGAGALLLSGQGRVLATIVDDTSGRHDALCGHGNRRAHEARFGHGGVHGPSPATRDLLALGAARVGLTRRDIGAGVNLFKGVRVAGDGALIFDGLPDGAAPRPPGDGAAPPGEPAHVELRLELDLVVVVANAPHPLDRRSAYRAGRARFTAWSADRAEPDPFRATTPERERAFQNTDDHLLGFPS